MTTIRRTLLAGLGLALLLPATAPAQVGPASANPAPTALPGAAAPTVAPATPAPGAPGAPAAVPAEGVVPKNEAGTAPADPGAGKPVARTKRLVPDDPKKVYLFLDPVSVQPPEGDLGGDLAAVLTRLARVRINLLESVRLKTYQEMPEVPEVMARFGDLEKLDRVSLIAIKNLTGFDGLVRMTYGYEGDQVHLRLTCFDFRNGQIARKRELTGPLGADLFSVVEGDLTEFATLVRRSYRVTLEVKSSPEGATVRVNQRVVGKTPLVHELQSGEYTIKVEQEGFKPFEERYQLSDSDRLHLDVTLYNPLAARFLNAEPGFRIDSRELDLGYQYVFLDLDRPGVTAVHSYTMAWLLRFLDWDVGVSWATSLGTEGENRLDTFLGEEEGLQHYDINLQRFLAVVKYSLLEKYSFASLRLGASGGMAYASTDDGDRTLTRWTPSASLFLELVSQLVRGGNFSLEAQLDLGAAYLGQLPYTERTFSLFGAAPAEEQTRAMFGPMAAIALRLVFWNGIF